MFGMDNNLAVYLIGLGFVFMFWLVTYARLIRTTKERNLLAFDTSGA